MAENNEQILHSRQMTQQANRIWFFLRLSCILSAFLVLQVKARTWGTTALWKPVICGSGTVHECSEHFPKEENCTRARWTSGWLTTTTLCSTEVTLLLQALPPRGTPQPASTPFSLSHSLFFKFSLPYGWQLWMHMQLNKLSMESHSPPPCHIHFSSSQNGNVFNSGN